MSEDFKDRFKDHYTPWQKSRLAGIEKYLGFEFFRGKTVSEIGCGHAYFGNFLSDYCEKVYVSDARQEHVDHVKEFLPHLECSLLDVDGFFTTERTDVLIDFGVLYHIDDVEGHIRSLQNYDYVILESEISDSEQDGVLKIDENSSFYDQSFTGRGSRPTRMMVERLLSDNGFDFRIILDPVINTDFHIYDWSVNGTGSWAPGRRRFWICWKKELGSPISTQ